MKNFELQPLNEKEMRETNGGLFPLLAFLGAYTTVCATAAALGAGVALIQNQLDKK